MPLKSMQHNDKVDFQGTATYLNVPSGSIYTTCKTFFISKQSSNIITGARRCSKRSVETSTSPSGALLLENETGANALQYLELVPKLHNHHCTLTNTSTLTSVKKMWRTLFQLCFIPMFSLQKNFSFTVTKTFLLMCLIFVTMLCAEGAPASKVSFVKSPSSKIEKNLTLPEIKLETKMLTHEKVFVDSSASRIVMPSMKIKRSTSTRKRPKKGGKRKRPRKNRKPRRKRPHRKGRRQRRPVQKTVPFSPDVIHRNRDEVLTSPRRQRLYNKNGNSFHLAIWKDGSISGEDSAIRSNNSILEIRGVGAGGKVTIMGAATKRFICVTKKGVVKTRKKYKRSRCQFMEKILINNQNTYESLSCKGCFLNLNKKGRVRKLKGANPKLIQAHFLPLKIGEFSARKLPNYLPAKKGEILSIDFTNFNGTKEEIKNLIDGVLPKFHGKNGDNDVSENGIDVIVPSVQKPKTAPLKKSRHSSRLRKLLNHKKFVKMSEKPQVATGLGKKSKKTPTIEAHEPAAAL